MSAEMPRKKTTKESAETFPLKVLDPILLMRDNAAFSSLDPEALAGKFNPVLYKPIDFVRVQYGKNDVQDRIRDGHNRTAGAAEYKQTPEGKNFEFRGQDITQHIIDEKYGGKGENLTPIQYLESIGGPTKKEFMEVRMAGHIMTEWNGIVGKEAAEDLPALAALSVLAFSPLGFESPKMIEKKITSHEKIVVKETPEKREKLEAGIVKIAGVIRNVQRVYDDITQAAFTIAANELSPEKLQEQVKGFLSLPEVDAKIKSGADEERVAQRKKLLAESLIATIKEGGEIRDRRALYQLLTDATLNFGMTNSLLQPSDKTLMIRYNEVKGEQTKPRRSSAAVKKDTSTQPETIEKIVYRDREVEKPFDFSQDLAPLPYIMALRKINSPVDEMTLNRMMAVQGEISRIRELTKRRKAAEKAREQSITRIKPAEAVLALPTKEKMTSQITTSAQEFYPSLVKDWDKITRLMRKSNVNGKDSTGVQAVEESLSSRLLNVMGRLQIRPDSDEVKFLSANHYLLGVRGRKQTEETNTQIEHYESEMAASINNFTNSKSDREKDYYTLLQFGVYGMVGSSELTSVLNDLQRYKKRPYDLDDTMKQYATYLERTKANDIQDVFNFRILAKRIDER